MRTFRRRSTVLAATTTAVLALTLTACGDDGTGTQSAGPATSTGAAVAPQTPESGEAVNDAEETGTDTEQAASTAKGSGATGTTGSTGSPGSTGSTADGSRASVPLCTAQGLKITAERQDGPPYTHLTLAAKNTSGAGCEMKEYPHIHFLDNARGIVPAVAQSKPSAPVILEPGQSAYAAVRMSDGGRKESTETVKEFTVTLKANGGGMAVVKSPAPEGLAVNPQKWATGYWTTELRNGADEF
ncbi:DUF4232 domain-containing protein [Streptomyces cavourensis]|uniref:DUF4232 domain-containing protein n=1 Tax=Streptomyces cavourensis TaxID=67258 RepID=UPI0020C949FA|nr:DUF4232 domain-containing protein [Streptomyces cavourensis]